MAKINKELLKGSFDLVVLAALKEEALYGYEIAKRIKKLSRDAFDMGEGTLYPLLHKLEQKKLLQSYWQEVDGRRRKYYELTKKGKKELVEKKEEWSVFAKAVSAIITAA